ncbi:class I SAM-dependent methyltransferase [Devosia sp. PTR5]|jgi:tRNA (cmo5U34)-methyltransferase|uniref:Class I SAM-dependent methyltransferase n=1 Tax=Devosia oryzisoli TaxID=2774138 RepID=A0A927FR59_9HYPH|nr:class I SAM-dependent methyltransferase [Devosia oryzisoli]MBD8063862.1 class I SAM-dependent methyltransferase [Devosia oryzisoli]
MAKTPFTNASAAYLDGPRRQVPGFGDLHRMVSMLLQERVPERARILVLGAGGGLELKALADTHPDWRFVGVDPSAAMLDLAKDTAKDHLDRIAFVQGTVEAAPSDLFDGALCLLTFHFIVEKDRATTLAALRQRLVPGAPLVLAHLSFPQREPERSRWIARHVLWGAAADAGAAQFAVAEEAIRTRLTILDPAEEERMLRDAGFAEVELFYAGLSLRGWSAIAGH